MRYQNKFHLLFKNWGITTSGDSGTRATRAEPQNDAEATPALGLLGLSLSYEMMEGLLLFKF